MSSCACASAHLHGLAHMIYMRLVSLFSSSASTCACASHCHGHLPLITPTLVPTTTPSHLSSLPALAAVELSFPPVAVCTHTCMQVQAKEQQIKALGERLARTEMKEANRADVAEKIPMLEAQIMEREQQVCGSLSLLLLMAVVARLLLLLLDRTIFAGSCNYFYMQVQVPCLSAWST